MSAMMKADCGRLGREERFLWKKMKGLGEGDKGREEKRREEGDHEKELYHLRPEISLGLSLHARPPRTNVFPFIYR